MRSHAGPQMVAAVPMIEWSSRQGARASSLGTSVTAHTAPKGDCSLSILRIRSLGRLVKSDNLFLSLAQILTRELDSVGIRLNRSPPNITLTRKKTGGIHVSKSPSVTLTHVDEQMVKRILAVRVAALMSPMHQSTEWH